jgi:CHAD domain-containing protein
MADLRASLQAHVAALRSHAPNVSADRDPEELHDTRVAVRRLRALLRAARPLIDDARAEPLRGELGALGKRLGPARDADVLLAYLRAEMEGMDEPGVDELLERAAAARIEAYVDARAALDDDGFERLLHKLDAFSASVVIRDGSLDGLVAAQAKKLRKAMQDVSSDEALHDARIKAKRVRYAAEAAGDKQTAQRAKRLQDVVGEHQDAVVADQRLRELVDADTAILVGRLVERQAQRRRSSREALPKAWKKLDKTKA